MMNILWFVSFSPIFWASFFGVLSSYAYVGLLWGLSTVVDPRLLCDDTVCFAVRKCDWNLWLWSLNFSLGTSSANISCTDYGNTQPSSGGFRCSHQLELKSITGSGFSHVYMVWYIRLPPLVSRYCLHNSRQANLVAKLGRPWFKKSGIGQSY